MKEISVDARNGDLCQVSSKRRREYVKQKGQLDRLIIPPSDELFSFVKLGGILMPTKSVLYN